LIAELNLNDIKGIEQPALDAWSTAAALAAVTEKIELMVAVRPNFHHPALFAKAAANIDRISGGRLALNVVSSWWADEARQYGLQFDQHDDRYARTEEWLDVVDGLWTQERFSFDGQYLPHRGRDLRAQARQAPDRLCRAARARKAKTMIAAQCDAYVMHGDPVRRSPEDRRHGGTTPRARRRRADARMAWPPMRSCATARRRRSASWSGSPTVQDLPAGYANFDQWLSGTQLERELKIQEYSVSNRGLRPNLVGTPEQLRERIAEYEAAGLDLLLLQMSPQAEEMERFAAQVMGTA
jgi:FMNH2-dependent dimethyl sulfone monooxygenase